MVDDQLRLDEQIDNISKKVSQGIDMLRRATVNSLLKEKRSNFFIILWFNPILGIAPWFGATAVNHIQNRAARVITGDIYDIRSKDVLKKLNWKNDLRSNNTFLIIYCQNKIQILWFPLSAKLLLKRGTKGIK